MLPRRMSSQQLRGKWATGEVPQYVKAFIWAWERLPQTERNAMMTAAKRRFEDGGETGKPS